MEDTQSNNENFRYIKLNFIINGVRNKYSINCHSHMRISDLIGEIGRKISTNLKCPLFIYEGKKLDENLTLGRNGLENDSLVTIIHGVHYWV